MKKLISKKTCAALSCILGSMLICSSALADDKKANYVQGQLGIFGPASDLDDSDYGTGFNGSIAYGRYINSFIKIEGMIDLIATDSSMSSRNNTLGNYDQDNYLSATGFLVTVKGEHSIDKVDLFGGLGAGFYVGYLSAEIDSDRLGEFNKNEYDTTFGAHVSLGANYNFTDSFYMGLEGRYRWTGDLDISESVADTMVNYEGDLTGYTVALTAGFRF